MPISTSPRSRDSLEYEENPQDPRLDGSLSSLNLSPEFEDYELQEENARPQSAGSAWLSRRRQRQSQSRQNSLDHIVPFSYQTVADGDTIRLALIKPGIGADPIECELRLVDYKQPQRSYSALSYCWQGSNREGAIICDGRRFSVTLNLLSALTALRQRDVVTTLWVDQICICQEDDGERAHQVNIMKYIYSKAKEVIVWLGEKADDSDKLFDFARKMRRGEATQTAQLTRVLPTQQRKRAVQKLLLRPWFFRVWTIQEVALSQFTTVACGSSRLSWDNLVRLIKDVQLPQAIGFQKTTALLGNIRQRIAILTQMAASQKAGLAHADITQLLILAKGSQATNPRDKIYAFYGLTHISTFPDYGSSVEKLYTDIAKDYVNNIQHVDSYANWHQLSDEQRAQQLMSILYSAGILSQNRLLPSWVPDWDCEWRVRPLWCQATSSTSSGVSPGSSRNNWTSGLRSQFRAGGTHTSTFDVLPDSQGQYRLRLKAKVFDTVAAVDLHTEPGAMLEETGLVVKFSPTEPWHTAETLYGRHFFTTKKGFCGIALPGIRIGDVVAVVFGGDVPVVLRPCGPESATSSTYKLMCECSIRSEAIMQGEMLENQLIRAEEIVIV